MDVTWCQRCKDAGLKAILDSPIIAANGIGIMEIGRPRDKTLSSSCAACDFFHQFAPEYSRKYVLHLRLFDHIPSFPGMSKPSRPKTPFLSIVRLNSRLSYDDRITKEIAQNGLITFVSPSKSHCSQISLVDPHTPDYPAFIRRLEHCIHTHVPCRELGAKFNPLFYIRLIDCEEEHIVRQPIQQGPFCTLSYVWGIQKTKTHVTANHRSFMDEPPLTVRDAIQVVRRLGRRYLWVDRYCIDYENSLEKEQTIQNMDMIYEASELTIVALYGDCDEAGLPGVSSVKRTNQPVLQTVDGCLVSSFPPVKSVITKAKWNSPGWTYQEARLSRRCLFFSEHQVYFVCRESTWSETVPYEPVSSTLSEILNSERLDSSLFADDDFVPAGHSSECRDRLQYSKRALSRSEDALNAFRGLLRRSVFITFWGVPVFLRSSKVDPNVGLALGLLWRKRPPGTNSVHLLETDKGKTLRGHNFPTWSWASVDGQIYQENNTGATNSIYVRYMNGEPVEFPQNEAQVKFWLYINSQPVYLPDAIGNRTSDALPEHSQQLLVEGDLVSIHCRFEVGSGKWFLGQVSGRVLILISQT